MFRSIWQSGRRLVRRQRPAAPLVSPARDLRLLRRIHGQSWPRLKQIGHVPKLLSPRERQVVRWCLLAALVGVLWLAGAAIGRYRVQVPAVGGAYTEAVVGSPQLVNPIFAPVNDVDRDLTRLIFSGLMRYDERQALIPDLAVGYEVSEDKKTYTFQLRADVVWHDGAPFTAADVVFTIQTIQNHLVNSPLLVSFQGVEVAALDEHQVRFVLPEPFAPFLSSLTTGILPEHVWFDVPPERVRFHRQNIQPVGTGPFMFKKLTKDETGYIHTYELSRFDRFYRTPAYLASVTFRFFSEFDGPNGAIQALRGQRVEGLNFVPHDLREKAERKHLTLHTLQLPQYTALFFNQEQQPALKQSVLRSALTQALDKERLLREALQDDGQIIHSPILPGFPGYAAEAEKISYNVAAANELLDKSWKRLTAEEYRRQREAELIKERAAVTSTAPASGETAGATDVTTTLETIMQAITAELNQSINPTQTFYRQDKEGRVLSLRLVTANTQEYQQAARLIAGFWQEIGVKTDLSLVDPKDISRTVLKGRQYDVLLYGMILGSDPDQFPFWHSTQVDFPGLNLARYINRNADALLEKMRGTAADKELAELAQKFQELISKDQPAIFLYTPTYTYATSDKVKGIDVVRIFHPSDRFAQVTAWYVETKGNWKLETGN